MTDKWEIFLVTADVISNFAQTGIAGFGLWLGWRTFLKQEEQETTGSSNSTETESLPGTLKDLKIFETTKQTTWLKTTEHGLECHLEDSRPNRGGHKWTISKLQAQSILTNGDLYVNASPKIRTGLLSIGRHSNWLYSKKFFPEPAILHHSVITLLKAIAE